MSGLAEILDENTRLRESLSLVSADLTAVSTELAGARVELSTAHTELETALSTLKLRDEMLEVLKQKAELLAHRLELLQLKYRRPASERFVPDDRQAQLFADSEVPPPPRDPVPEPQSDKDDDATNKPTRRPRRKGTRRPRRRNRENFNHMPSDTVHVPAGDAACPSCGEPLKKIGEARSFRIEWVPGHFMVHDVIRDKVACPHCPSQGVLTASGPYALDRSLAANGLIARVIVDKFADHIPANRQAKRMAREGFEVGSHTLSSWIGAASKVLKPVAKAVREEVLSKGMLQGDDTGMPVQDGGDGQLRKGRMWAFTDQEQVFYAFTDTKQGKHPAALLGKYQGRLLLVDGGSEFNQVVRKLGLARAGCWSHLRTYFFKAITHHPNEAVLALATIRDLFMIEREIRGREPGAILAERKARSRPLVNGFFDWVKAMSQVVRPKSILGEALRYARNQEAVLRLFLRHGELPIHNNLSELMLRQTVIGRKNWLFARSEGGALAAATLYTLIGSCALQGIDPWVYLKDLLDRLLDYPSNRVGELTPRQWRLAREHHTVTGR